MRKKILVLFLGVIISLIIFTHPNQSNSESSWRISGLTDTWVATDDLGRTISTNNEAGDVVNDKYVGIFYFLFLDTSYKDMSLNDKSLAYREGGTEAVWDVLVRGGIDVWTKPYLGYYENTDEWVYRKHANMLSAAGVDFIFLDITNPNMYTGAWKVLFDTWHQIREEGGMTPQIIFHCGDDPDRMTSHMKTLWNTIYKSEQYKELWFMWEGKPLILGNSSKLEDTYKEFFTIRKSWAFNNWVKDENGLERWPWMAEYPQEPGKNKDGEIEQMSVSAGFHATTSRGRSFVNGAQTTNKRLDFGYSLDETKYGLAFKEQWEHALEVDPKIIMLTGWNEFHNGGSYAKSGEVTWKIANTYTTVAGDLQYGKVFVDCFSAEFSRDIEPIDGFFKDNYYYQMCDYIRKFKGVTAIPEGTGSKEIILTGGVDQWDNIGPGFQDITGDIAQRDHQSVTGAYQYTNTTGRNDISLAKVSKNDKNTYFYVSCKQNIRLDDSENWMNLFIDADQNHETGWEGYDFVVNRSRTDNYISIEKIINDKWEFQKIGQVEYVITDNVMVLKVPSKMIGLSDRDNFDFKWADNSTVTGNVMEFMDQGDAAPDSRFNFRYIKQDGSLGSVGPVNTNNNKSIMLITGIVLVVAGISRFVILIKRFAPTRKIYIKRLLILSIAIIVLACGTTTYLLISRYVNEKNTIILLVKNDISVDADMSALQETISEYITAYNKVYPKVRVNIEYVKDFPVDSTYGDLYLIAADSALEYMASPAFAGTKFEADFINLNEYYMKNNIKKEDILPTALKLGEIEGSQQWIPFNYDRSVVLCDKNVFELLGVKMPSSDWNYAQFVAAAESLTKKHEDVNYTGVYLPYHESFLWKLYVKGFGGNWYMEDEHKLNLTTGNSYSGLLEMFNLLQEGNAKAYDYNIKNSDEAIAGMSVAFACQPERNGIYNESTKSIIGNPAKHTKELLASDDLVIIPIPSFPNGNVGTCNTEFLQGFAVSAKSEKQEIAASLALFSQSLEGQEILNKYYGGIPTNKMALNKDFWKTGILSGDNAVNVLINIDMDERDDFFDAFKDSKEPYSAVLRTRVFFSALLFQRYGEVNKKISDKSSINDNCLKILKDLEKNVNIVLKSSERKKLN